MSAENNPPAPVQVYFIAKGEIFMPNSVFRTAMPKKVRPDIYVPSDEDIKRPVQAVKDTDAHEVSHENK